MQVTFRKHEDNGRRACSWEATRAKRTCVPGPYMAVGRDLPHDLGQYVVEAATGYRLGFWGLLEQGATYRSTGRRRTQPGRAVIAEHRSELDASEELAGLHLAAWKRGDDTAVTRALDTAMDQWRSLGDGGTIAFTWPSPHGTVTDPGRAIYRARDDQAGDRPAAGRSR